MRRGEHVPRAFQAPVDVHASADGQVYVFKRKTNESTVSSDDEELSVLEMRPRAFQELDQDKLRNVELLERELLDDDNLNKLALQYGCKVADIKRVNNLMQEQDLFALKSIKIPVQKHSFLTEDYTDPNDPVEEMPHSSATPLKPPDRTRGHPHIQEVTDFLMEVDNDIEKLIQSTNDHDDDLLDNSERREGFGFRGKRLTTHGADWGINWWNAVIAMLLIGIVLPLFYVIYFKTKENGGGSPAEGSGVIHSVNSSGTDPKIKGPLNVQEPG